MGSTFSLLFLILLLSLMVAIPIRGSIISLRDRERYKKTSYYQITRTPYSVIRQDSGRYGEFLIYAYLRDFEEIGGMFLFNLYIPKSDGSTTEIDVLLICSKGIFVFESKNYSGWIFGNENHKNWTQTLPSGWNGECHKERFYNPIMQNAMHIKHLGALIEKNIPLHSIVVFSDRCTLKDISVTSGNVSVIYHGDVFSVVNQICSGTQNDILSQFEIYNIYNKLYPYTQATNQTKQIHEDNLQKSY